MRSEKRKKKKVKRLEKCRNKIFVYCVINFCPKKRTSEKSEVLL